MSVQLYLLVSVLMRLVMFSSRNNCRYVTGSFFSASVALHPGCPAKGKRGGAVAGGCVSTEHQT